MTRRERMEQREERRAEWAEKREASARAASTRRTRWPTPFPSVSRSSPGTTASAGCNDRARIDGAMSRGVADARMAEHHASRAAGIARQLDTSVYSDDVDAIERLRDRPPSAKPAATA